MSNNSSKLIEDDIQQYFSADFLANNKLMNLHLFDEVDSTNTWLKQKGQCGDVCIAEQQSAGRGRRGNEWLSPNAENIYLSLQWCFERTPQHFSLLSLIVGLSIVKTLAKVGLREHGVKWPNDIFWQGQKMGGILLESVASVSGQQTIIGIGLNINMPASVGDKIDQPWVSLSQVLNTHVDRNHLLALLLEQLFIDLDVFSQLRIDHFQTGWKQWDVLNGQHVTVLLEGNELSGVVDGINEQGCIGIKLESGKLQYYSSAEIRLKK